MTSRDVVFYFFACDSVNDPEVINEALAVARIVLGAHNKDINEDTQVKARVKNIFTYPGWDAETIDNDIMLIKLTEDVEFNDAISPVCLPPAGEELPAETIMQTSGWGRLECKLQYFEID